MSASSLTASVPEVDDDDDDDNEIAPFIVNDESDGSESGDLLFSSQYQNNDNREKKNGSRLWFVLAFVMVAVTVFFAVDSHEIEASTPEAGQDIEQKANTTAASGGAILQSHPTTVPAATTTPSTSPTATRSDPPRGDAEYFQYQPRGRPLTEASRRALIDEWGAWSLDEALSGRRVRLESDFYAAYPNRDVPREEFPANAWQTDVEYLSKFLPEGLALVGRAQEAILAEYGHGRSRDNETDVESPEAWWERARMFQLAIHDSLDGVTVETRKNKKGDRGGWTTASSWDGLKRRILHAIMTEDSFVFAMGGHSAAAGHGNHFQQSYTLQVQWILEAVFARLGVRHEARNFGNGGLGTVHNAMAATSIYGPDVDVLMWDSSMTEKGDRPKDLFHRQALMGGDGSYNAKVPVLWTNAGNAAKFFNQVAGADVGGIGSGMSGIAAATSFEDLDELPWAARYMACSPDLSSICSENRYDGICWLDRPDFTPTKEQQPYPGGRAGWHPGNREHQLTGRVLTFTFLQAMKEALTLWNDAAGYALADEAWHMTTHYDTVRAGVYEHTGDGHCNEYWRVGMTSLCKFPMKGRTEFTPRAYPTKTSLRSLMPPEMLNFIDPPEENVYEPPDVFNPALHPRDEDAVDVLSIVEAGPLFQPVLKPDYATRYYKQPTFAVRPKVPVGKGVTLDTRAGDHLCDGTLDSWCDRGTNQACLLQAHNDGRNGLLFDGYSGWVVMNIPDLRNGFIVIKFESWHPEGSASKTEGWSSINNEGDDGDIPRLLRQSWSSSSDNDMQINAVSGSRRLVQSHIQRHDARQIEEDPGAENNESDYCQDFRFEYSVDSIITSLNSTEFERRRETGKIQRVVETLVLLDDRDFTGGVEKEVEVAVRITGCGRKKTFRLSHIYWS
jgi:hypothetical protein